MTAVITVPVTIPYSRYSTHSAHWFAARALGPWSRLVLNDVQAFAHTSPVYISVGDKPIASAEDARFWIAWIDQLIAQVNDRGRFSTAERRKEVIELFRRAQDAYRRSLSLHVDLNWIRGYSVHGDRHVHLTCAS